MGNESSTLALLHNLAELESAIHRDKTTPSVQSQHGWNSDDRSPNIQVLDGNIKVKRGQKGDNKDVVRGLKPYHTGIHFFQFNWNPGQNKHVSIGVATKEAALSKKDDEVTLGSDDRSIGFDLVAQKIYFNGCEVKDFPPLKADVFQLPACVTMILDMENGTLSFKSEIENYGVAMRGLTHIADEMYVAGSLDQAGDTLTVKYLGGSDTVTGVRLGEVEGIRFHEVCGKNVQLEDHRTRARRINPRDTFVSATVLTERPLKDGEMFEIKLEEKDASKWEGSWMFGVTTTSPLELHFPKEMSSCEQGDVWIYNENKIGHQGIVIEELNANLDEMEKGDTVGVMKTANQLQFFVDGNRQTTLLIETDDPVYGVVDIYGQATCISIQGHTSQEKMVKSNIKKPVTADEFMTALEKTVAILKRKDPKEITVASQMVGINLDSSYHRISGKRLKRLAAEKLAKLDGARIITEYLDFLEHQGLEDQANLTFFFTLKSVCWNYCDNSLLLCCKFGECGLLDKSIRDIKGKSKVYQQNKRAHLEVTYAFGILHNCSKATQNKPIFRKHNFIAIAKDYTDASMNPTEIVLHAIFTISYICDVDRPDQVKYLLTTEQTAKEVVAIISRAVESSDHQHDGWHAYEIAVAITNLSAQSTNVKYFVQNRCIKPLVKMLDFNDVYEKECALNAIWRLANDSNKIDIAGTHGLNQKLKELEKSPHESIEQAAVRLRMKLEVSMTQQMIGPAMFDKCQYKGLCCRFLKTLDLSEHYFDKQYDMCFCAVCHGTRGDQTKYTRGNPPKQYGVPVGWYRFGLTPPPRTRPLKAFEEWHRAFHGTKKDSVKKILEVGEIVPAGRAVLGGKNIRERPLHYTPECKPEGFDTKQVFLSQSIRYAGIDAYATPFTYRDQTTRKAYNTKVAFQVLLEPDSYKVGPETVGARSEIDPGFSNQELEWSTAQQGVTIIYGLLVKIDD